MSHIIGIDLSLTSTGLAVLDVGLGIASPTRITSICSDGKKGDTYKQRSRRLRTLCRDIMKPILDLRGEPAIRLAVIEGPLYGVKTLPSYFDRAGLFHGIYAALDAQNIPISVVAPSTAHQFVTGKGHPADLKKSDIIEETRKWWPAGPRITNDDEADALGLATMGAMWLGAELPFTRRLRHANAIATAAWPDMAPDAASATPGRRIRGIGAGA